MQVIQWNPWVLKIFIYFVSCANEEPSVFRNIPIQRGQLLRTIDRIAEDLKYPVEQMTIEKRQRYHALPRRTLERYLDYMVQVAQLIEKQKARFGLLITVKNYDSLSRLPLKDLALLDTNEVAFINKGKEVTLQGNILLQHARDIQAAWGKEKALLFCQQRGMSEEDIERALNPVPIPGDIKAALRARLLK